MIHVRLSQILEQITTKLTNNQVDMKVTYQATKLIWSPINSPLPTEASILAHERFNYHILHTNIPLHTFNAAYQQASKL